MKALAQTFDDRRVLHSSDSVRMFDDRIEQCIDGALIARVRAEYWEMPGLCLTVQQACRLWQLDLTDCTRILELLVAQHVLTRSATGVFIAGDLRCPEGSIRREAQK